MSSYLHGLLILVEAVFTQCEIKADQMSFVEADAVGGWVCFACLSPGASEVDCLHTHPLALCPQSQAP